MPAREETVRAADLATCDCDPCKRKKGLPHGVHSLAMHSYSSQPSRGWIARKTAAERTAERETGNPTPTFGVELETSVRAEPLLRNLPNEPRVLWLSSDATYEERLGHDRDIAAHNEWSNNNRVHLMRQVKRNKADVPMTADEAVSMAAPRGLWHVKYDSSVSGPEFASHPATLAYWHKARPYLTTMYKSLLHGGMRSHDGDTCGLHINIGTNAFANSIHLARFAQMVVHNQRWSMRMSQRTLHSTNRWASFGGELARANLAEWAYMVMRYGRASQDRYCVLNASNEGRIEFRLPRGTLRIDRFYAKLEWTAAMVEYTRDSGHRIQVSAFMRWVAESDEYPELMSFMREKFRAAFDKSTKEQIPHPDLVLAPEAIILEPDLIADLTNEPDEAREDDRDDACECGDGCRDGECMNYDDENETCNSQQPDGVGYYCELTLGHSGQHGYPNVGVYWDDEAPPERMCRHVRPGGEWFCELRVGHDGFHSILHAERYGQQTAIEWPQASDDV